MNYNLRNQAKSTATVIGLFIFSLLFGFLTVSVGDIFMPLYSGVYAVLLLFDKNTKRILSAIVPITAIGFAVLFGNFVPVAQVISPCISFVIFYMFKNSMSKGECVGYSTALCSIMLLVSFLTVAFFAKESFSLDAVKEYYTEVYEEIKLSLISYFEKMAESLPEGTVIGVNKEQVVLLLDSFVTIIPSLIVIIAFLMVGIAFKIFSTITSRLIDNPVEVFNWRFSTSNIFAYFFIALVILSAFSGAADTFGIVVNNLYNIFMVVYAYIGFNFARAILMQRKSYVFSTLILIALIILLSSFAISILSFLGVYFNIAKNKVFGNGTDK